MIKIILKVIRLLLVAAVVFICVDLFYDFVAAKLHISISSKNLPEIRKNSEPEHDRSSRSAGGAEFENYAEIIQRDLFKTAKAPPPAETMDTSALEDLEKTKLNLTLWGTITGTDEKSYAVIEEKSKREQGLYRQGDTIDTARIKMILRKKVVLTVDGKDEILEMEEVEDHSGRVSEVSESRVADFDDISDQSPRTTVEVAREDIDNAMQDINNLMRQVRIRPYFENGQPSGIMLSGIQKNSIFSEMGLESGDIVKGVNGRQIKSVEDAMGFYENLKSSSQVELEIQRNGNRQTVSYQID
jgi:general secretion pathway protein C